MSHYIFINFQETHAAAGCQPTNTISLSFVKGVIYAVHFSYKHQLLFYKCLSGVMFTEHTHHFILLYKCAVFWLQYCV